jgi:hypothetical protein
MSDKNLRSALIRLAHTKPDLRAELLPLLAKGKQAGQGKQAGLYEHTVTIQTLAQTRALIVSLTMKSAPLLGSRAVFVRDLLTRLDRAAEEQRRLADKFIETNVVKNSQIATAIWGTAFDAYSNVSLGIATTRVDDGGLVVHSQQSFRLSFPEGGSLDLVKIDSLLAFKAKNYF